VRPFGLIKLNGSMIKKSIERILNRIGYYKSEMPKGAAVSEAEILEMFRTYGSNEMFKRLLRDLCANDIRVYFQASNDEDRMKVRGAYQRTNYFLSLINKANDPKRKGKDTASRGR